MKRKKYTLISEDDIIYIKESIQVTKTCILGIEHSWITEKACALLADIEEILDESHEAEVI